MSVTYTRVNFANRVVARPRTYTVTENQDQTVTLTPVPGEVITPGTPLSAANLNVMDKGVDDCAKAINDIETALNAKVAFFSAAIPSTGWTSQDSGAYYTISLTVTGILATDTPDIGIVQTGVWATDEAMRDAWSCVTRITASANDQLTITASEVPSVSIPIQVRCIR